jgi:hypothetical protein
LSVFYLLQQTVIGANADGTISAPNEFEPGEARFREVAPDVWHEVDGTRQLALRNVNGVKTVMDSQDPTSVLQEVPAKRSAPLNLTVLVGSFLVLAGAVLLWPVSYLVRRHYRPAAQPVETQRMRSLLRVAAAFDVVWLIAWSAVLTPALSVQLDFYGTGHDTLIRALQIAGLIVIALAVAGIWSAWRLFKREGSWASRVGNGLVAAALVGLVWIGFIGGLLGFNLNY